MKLKPHASLSLIYLTCAICLVCMLGKTQTLFAMPSTGQEETIEVIEVIEETAAPGTQAPMAAPTQSPAGQPQPTTEPGTPIDPAAQPTQLSGPDVIELEKTQPLLERQSPKTMELFSQAEKLCNEIQDLVKKIESAKEGLYKSYTQILEEKKLDLLIENANHKKGILQRTSDKK